MDLQSQKSEIINWISRLKDQQLLEKIASLKNTSEGNPIPSRMFGGGRHLIDFIADDFNEPIDHFDESIRP